MAVIQVIYRLTGVFSYLQRVKRDFFKILKEQIISLIVIYSKMPKNASTKSKNDIYKHY